MSEPSAMIKTINGLSLLVVAVSLHASSVSAASIMTIDPGGAVSLPPLIKSKLGVARASGYAELPATVPFTQKLGSRVFCSLIAFDQLTDRPRRNLALGAAIFTPEHVETDPKAKIWLQSLLFSLQTHRQVVYLSLVGAPSPYQQARIRKPAGHPTPTNISGSAEVVRKWIDSSIPSNQLINWVVWNEPEHTLRGVNNVEAANDMALIYQAYAKKLQGRSLFDGIGLASFMKSSLQNMRDFPSRSFAEHVFLDLKRNSDPRIDYITLNNFHGQTSDLIARLQSDLRRMGMDQPLVLNQFAPAKIGSQPSLAGSVQAASEYVQALDRFVQTPAVSSACYSFWSGSDRKALLRATKSGFLPSLPFQALSLYQDMPLWRLPVSGNQQNSPFILIAARDADRFSLLILPRSEQPTAGVPPGGRGKAERQRQRRALRQQERQELRRGRIETDAAIQATSTAPSMLALKFPSLRNTQLKVQRLSTAQEHSNQEEIRTDQAGRLTLFIQPDQIVMLSKGEASPAPPLLASVRSDLYIHRHSPEQGWASVDQLTDGFVLALPSKLAIAHASATYAMEAVPSSLRIQLRTPEGNQGLTRALACSAVVLQGLKNGAPITLASWGDTRSSDAILSSRAFASINSGRSPSNQTWPKPDKNGIIILPLRKPAKDTLGLRLHFAATGCSPGTQLQARVLR